MKKSSTVVPAKPEVVEPEPEPTPIPTPTPEPKPTPIPTPTPTPVPSVPSTGDTPRHPIPPTGIESRREVVNTSAKPAKLGVPNTGDETNTLLYTGVFTGSIALALAAGVILASRKEEQA